MATPTTGSLNTKTRTANNVSTGLCPSFLRKITEIVHHRDTYRTMLNMEPTIKPVVMGRLLNKRDTAIKIAEIKIDKKKYFWGNPAWNQPAFFDLFAN